MNAIENQVRQLVDVELAAANERFPQFHSAHEGWAVILEELEEVDEAVSRAKASSEILWKNIRGNEDDADVYAIFLGEYAINAACEAIQVAAMCKKFLDMGEK